MNITLGNDYTAVPGDLHYRAGVGRSLPKASQHGMPKRMYHELFGHRIRRKTQGLALTKWPRRGGAESTGSRGWLGIVLGSALDDVKSKVTGLKIGGVDYVAKPVHGEEVLARVRVHLRIRENNRALVEQHRARLEQLRDAQQAILVRPEDCPEANFAIYYKPLEEAGGDFYDVVPLGPGMFAYFVADISGHGVSAAFLTSAVKALLRQYAGPLFSPEDTMRGVDSVMGQMMGEEQYLTACYARLNRQTRRSL